MAITRREALAFSVLAARGLRGQESGGHLIIRQKEPENVETGLSTLRASFLTPNERFYIRSHFAVPQVNASQWRLRVEGAVEAPFEIGYDELQRLAPTKQVATLECAGNSRVFLVPAAAGVQWELGAVGNAEWGGVRLSTLLQRAKPKSSAVEVVLEGADRGEPGNLPKPVGPIAFARSLPLDKALKPEVLVATTMNGQPLPVPHGFPARVVVPGYYGMASIKWLTRIVVVERPFQGYWQTVDYAAWRNEGGYPVRRPLYEMSIKSVILDPASGGTVKPSNRYVVHGAAWTGDADITKVELSADGGQTWREAQFQQPAQRFAWRMWQADWTAPAQAGRYTLMSRATDSAGRTQPVKHNGDNGNYAIHHVLPITVQVV